LLKKAGRKPLGREKPSGEARRAPEGSKAQTEPHFKARVEAKASAKGPKAGLTESATVTPAATAGSRPAPPGS